MQEVEINNKEIQKKPFLSTRGLIVLGFMVCFSLLFSPSAHAANRYWVGSAGGNTNDTANWASADPASCTGGGASVPGTSDIAIFDADCDNNATINAAFSVAGININSGYTGTITQSTGITVAVGSSSYAQSDGTFTGGNSAITVTDGNFILNSGTFTNTTGGLNLERNLTINGGTFTNTGATVSLTDNSALDSTTLTCSTTIAGTVVITKDAGGSFTLSSGCTIDLGAGPTSAMGTSSSGSYINNGTITVTSGTWTISGGSGRTFTNNGTITHNGSGWTVTGLNFTNSNGATITYAGTTATFRRSLTQSGTFDTSGKTITFSDTSSLDDSTLTCSGTFGGTVVISKSAGGGAGDFTLSSGCSISLGAAPTSNMGDAGGTYTNNGTMTIESGTWSIVMYHSTFTNNGTVTHNGSGLTVSHSSNNGLVASNFTNSSTGTMTYSGTTMSFESNFTQNGTFNLSGKTISFIDGSNFDDSTLSCSGTLGGSIVVTKDNGADFTLSSGCSASLGASPTTTISNNGSSAGLFTNNGTLTIDSGTWTMTSTATANATYTNNGTITHSGDGWDINNTGTTAGPGSFTNASGATITYSGTSITTESSFTQSGTFDLTGKTITFDGTATTDAGVLTCGSAIGSVVVNKTGVNTFGLGSDCTLTGSFTRTDGTFSNPSSAYILTVQGDFSMSTTDTFGGANLTLTMSGSSSQSVTQNAGSMSGVFKVNKSGSAATLSTDFSTGLACNVVEGTFSINGKAFTCGSTFTVEDGGNLQRFGTSGESLTTPTLNSGSTVTYTGDGDTAADTVTITTMAATYHHLTINSTDGTTDTFQLGAALDVNGNLTLTAGVLDISGSNYGITVGGNWTDTGSGTFTEGTGTVTFDGSGTINANEAFNTVVVSSSGNTLTLGAALDVNGNLTISAGTLDVSASNYGVTLVGNWSNSGTFTARSGTVTLDGTSTGKTITTGGSAFYNLTVNGSGGAWTTSSATNVSNVLTITAGTLITDSSGSVTTSGTGTTISIGASGTLTNNGSLSIAGAATPVSNSGTWTNASTSTVTLTGQADNTGVTVPVIAYGNLVVDRNGTTFTLSSSPTINGNLTITNGTFDVNGNNLTLSVSAVFSNSGTLQLQGAETFTNLTMDTDSGTVLYNGSGTYSSLDLGNTYYHLTINGSGTWTLTGLLTTNGNLAITSGTVNFNGFNVTVAGNFTTGGTLQNIAPRTITLNGTTQTFTPGSITFANLLLTGSSGTVSLGSNFTTSDLISIAAGRTLSLTSRTITSNGLITNSGTINEGSGAIIDPSSSFYIADSNFDINDAISLGSESLYVSLTDEDGNLNASSADTLTVTVSCPTDSESITLTETGNATEVFRSSALPVTLYDGSASNNDGTLECNNGVTITATYTDAQDGTDTQSDTATATTDTTPTAPSSFAGSAQSSTSIQWTWTDNANNETGFKLYDGSNNLIATIATTNATSYTETGLTKGTSYTRKVVSYNGAGNSSYSNSATVSTPAEPTAPSSFSGSAQSPTSIQWTWTDNSSDEDGFRLLDSSNTVIATIAANTTSYTETGLSANTSYTRKVVAYNSDGTSTASNTATISTGTSQPPTAPSLISPASGTVLTSNLPTFSFRKGTDSDDAIASYTLHVGSLLFANIPASAATASNPISATHVSDRYVAQYFNENDGNDSNDSISVTLKADNSSLLPLDDGEYGWYVVAVDEAGNTATSSDRSIIIDASKPEITTISVTAASQRGTQYTTQTIRPTVTVNVRDGRLLDQLLITLERPVKLLAVTTSYTPIESSTFALTSTQDRVSFTPKSPLTPGESYRLQLALHDAAGNEVSQTITLAVLTEEQATQEEIKELDSQTTPTETIIETLREALPETPLSIPSLQERALLRRQKQIEQFNLFTEQFNALIAQFFSGQGVLERAVVAVLNAAGNVTQLAGEYVSNTSLAIRQVFFSGWTSVRTFAANQGSALLARVVETYIDSRNVIAFFLQQAALVANNVSEQVAQVSFFTPLQDFASRIAISAPDTTAKQEAQHVVAQQLTAMREQTIALFGQSGRFLSNARETRVRSGLANRQRVADGIQVVLNPGRVWANRVALKVRSTYELWFDKSPTHITNVRITSVTPTSAVVEWDTNHVTRLSKVNYGPTKSYGQEVISHELDNHHRIELGDLDPNTTYYFEIMNQNGDYVFDAYYSLTTLPEGDVSNQEFIPQDVVIESEGAVSVYEDPNPTADILTEVEAGSRFRALTNVDGWVSILLPTGDQGWIEKQYIRLESETQNNSQNRQIQ